MIDYAYQPSSVQVSAGGSVTFVNNGPDEPHTATGSGFDTGEVGVGGSATVAFDQPGTFPYVCTLHPNMKGSVTVLATERDTGGGGTTSSGSSDGTTPGGVAGPTEEAAVTTGAGGSTALPATGDETGLLAAFGLALLAAGLQLAAAQRLLRR